MCLYCKHVELQDAKVKFYKIICILGECKRGKYEVLQNHEA